MRKLLLNTETSRIALDGLRRDALAIGLIMLTLLLLAGLWLWLFTSFESLPDLLPLHFDAQGNADRIAERREIFTLPTIAAILALLNLLGGVLLRVRWGMVFASYLLWAGALMTQLLFWIAAWNITH